MRGFATFLALTLAFSVTNAAVAYHAAAHDVADMQLAVLELGQRRVIGADVSSVLSEAVIGARGGTVLETAADAVARLALAETHLESFYKRQGVDLDVAVGRFLPAEKTEWLESKATGRIASCPDCRDASRLSPDDWLSFQSGRFSFLGAFFSFGDLAAFQDVAA